MCFPRKPGLGRYNSTREEWVVAYREARVAERDGSGHPPSLTGLRWKAGLIVAFDRSPHIDPLRGTASGRLLTNRLIEEILGEERNQA